MLVRPTAISAKRPSTRTTPTRSTSRYVWLLALSIPLASLASAQSVAQAIPARWGQASALVGSLFVVQGGKTQGTTGGGFTYSSAPSDAHMYALDLSASFSLASPPWQAVSLGESTAAAPAVSFHTISPLNSTSLLLFGGDGSPTVPVQTNNDSAFILNLGGPASNRTISYLPVPASWNQPMRRVYHTSEANGRGSVWILGGEKADGSGLTLDERWSIDTSASSPLFQLASTPPPGSLVGSTSTLLSDGTLLLLGGIDTSGQLQSMQNIYSYSTTSNTWTQTATQAAANTTDSSSQKRAPVFPAPRRDHVAVSLPNQRLFIQGGASQDLSTVFSDAWILDWSVNPPVWTQIDSTSGPGARFGHSAVAYGREILISFGWAGGNAAPTGVHVFDATTLTADSSFRGSWSGGTWSSSTYTPDPQMSRPAPGKGSSPGSSSTSNGSSSSSGGTANTDGGTGSADDGTGTTSGSFPTGSATHGDGDSSSSGTSDGAKAGAAIGAILGAGLVVGAGYAVYRRRSLNNYRRYGRGSPGVLGFAARRGDGPSDDDYLMEKGFIQGDYDRPYHRTEGAAPLTGGVAYGRKRARNEGSPWTAGNVGHAMEGSGPHFRERIAILAGRGKRDAHVAPRVDMLADEGDGNSLFRPLASVDRLPTFDHDDDDDNEEAANLWHDRRMREHSYMHVGDQDLSCGDLGRLQHDDDAAEHEYSPFEDRPEEARGFGFAAAVGAHGYGQLADREQDPFDDTRRSDDERSDVDTHEGGASSGPSLQSHSTASRSDVPSSSKSSDALSSGALVSFSDASHGRRASSNMMKRSPTWWDRFMGNSLLERSASGRLLSGPNAAMPIRDPAPPPVSGLEAIRESPRSREVSEQNPFADGVGLDEHGRRTGSEAVGHEQGPSISSVGSARTGASSHFESRLRNMDVIQRVRTGSSRRTYSMRTRSSVSDNESDPALSRAPTLLRPRNIASSEAVDRLDEDEAHEEVVWKPELWSGRDAALEDVSEEADASSVASPVGRRARPANVSETPSITPLTTKRARLNPVMVSPLFPSPAPRAAAPPAAPVASVKERVKAFETSATPAPPSAWSASLSKAPAPASAQSVQPPTARADKRTYTTLVPKPTLFVANPDASHV